MIYFDHAASWPILPEAMQDMAKSFEEDFANSSAAHKLGAGLAQKIDDIRKEFIAYFNGGQKLEQNHFYFTGSATESNNWAIAQLSLEKSDAVMYSPADHPSITVPLEKTKRELLSIPRNTDGRLNQEYIFQNAKKCKAIFLTWVNGQSGVMEDLLTLSRQIKEINPKIYIHIDGSQGFARHSLMNGKSMISPFDSFAISSHKMGGPKGIAGIYFKQTPKAALIHGGGHESGMRAGTVAYPLVVGFHRAFTWMTAKQNETLEKICEINTLIRNQLSGNRAVVFPFELCQTSPYILMLIVEGVPSDVFLRHLEMEDIFCSSTAACSSKIKGRNIIFEDFKIKEDWHKNVLRISFGAQNNLEEARHFIKIFNRVYDTICMISDKR